MKKIFTFLVAVILTATLWAQAPQKMSYQAVIRNSSNALVTNTQVGMRISILQGSTTGTSVYTETQSPTTNANGLASIEIGGGAGFSSINWADGTYFIKTETDPTGGTTYSITGTSQLLSVPYALHSKTAESITGTITETDPIYTGSQAANITSADITKLNNLSGVNSGDQDLSGLATTSAVTTALNLKVDKETGKGLSAHDYTNADSVKVSNLSGTNTGDQDLSGLATKTALGDSIALLRSKMFSIHYLFGDQAILYSPGYNIPWVDATSGPLAVMDPDFTASFNNPVVTINNAGRYRVTYEVTLKNSVGGTTGNSASIWFKQTGNIILNGTNGGIYLGTTTGAIGSASRSAIYDFTPGQQLWINVEQVTGDGTMDVVSHGCQFRIERIGN
jgi:hypothetical protein